ncbi:MAG: hypothetical protein A3J63_03805 [Candidatus Moranbacteria bacterium RIFCSPHIGHO2_02_FULL_40_12b]|nr:MAG: hypothetical protein A3J63_03805 [Candidatus Moranbacteria bacterium RIFCSPHIGHO2_02_FULL_40_12b]OGI23789.1 MAG: hypothetical protein A3E91_00925 [Candidatus Moranbacteria bacterium RIFCSPHIGHO2_12_FULL_40_10]
MLLWKKEEKSLGQIGEDAAAKYLKKKGYKILERNYFNPLGRRLGEIDIVAEKEKEIIFVEVKTRVAKNYSDTLPEENINRSKLHKLNKIAVSYIRNKHLWNYPYHFDAISVLYDEAEKKTQVRHLKNVFI